MTGALIQALKTTIGLKPTLTVIRKTTLPHSLVIEIKRKKDLEKTFKTAQSKYASKCPDAATLSYVESAEKLYYAQKLKVESNCRLRVVYK